MRESEFHVSEKFAIQALYTINNIFSTPFEQIYLFQIKFCIKINLNVLNLMVMLTLSVLEWKYPFWANLLQKIQFACLRWKLVSILIEIFWIRWWCLFVRFCTGNTFIWANLLKTIKIVNLEWNLMSKLDGNIHVCTVLD